MGHPLRFPGSIWLLMLTFRLLKPQVQGPVVQTGPVHQTSQVQCLLRPSEYSVSAGFMCALFKIRVLIRFFSPEVKVMQVT